eukprot:7192321-Alexandrium_andersonii.AAC.1
MTGLFCTLHADQAEWGPRYRRDPDAGNSTVGGTSRGRAKKPAASNWLSGELNWRTRVPCARMGSSVARC